MKNFISAAITRLSNKDDPPDATTSGITAPVTPPIKLGGNGVPTKLAVNGEWQVLPIVHPMVMGFNGMTHFLHLGLMKFQRSLQLRGLMKHAGQLAIDKVVKSVVKGGVQGHGYTPRC